MKKVKMMLIATLVVAAVGGALAFKANNKFGTRLFCGTTNTTCPEDKNFQYTTAQGTPIPDLYCSTQATDNCPIRVELNK